MWITEALIIALMTIGVASLVIDAIVHARIMKRMDTLSARHERICKQLGINARKDDDV